jgi:hypothetical protein
MKEIIFGTQNKSKIDQVNGALKGTEFSVVGIPEGVSKLEVNEDGKTAQENAHKKATAYSTLLNKVVFAMDNALYFNNLSPDKQPGLKVRRFRDESRPGDNEMLEYYQDMISGIGGDEVDGWWEFGICIANPNGTCHETTIISPRKFIQIASKNVVAGYPLEAIQKDPLTDKIVSDMTLSEQGEFWKREIGTQLQKFITKILS